MIFAKASSGFAVVLTEEEGNNMKNKNTIKYQTISLITLILTMHAQIHSMHEMMPVHESIRKTDSGHTISRYDNEGTLVSQHLIDREGYRAYPMSKAKINSWNGEYNYHAYLPEERGYGVKSQAGEFVDQELINSPDTTTHKIIANPKDNGLIVEEYDLKHLFTNNPSLEESFSPGVPSRSSVYDDSGKETSRTYHDPRQYSSKRNPRPRKTTMTLEEHPTNSNEVIAKQYDANGKPSMYFKFNREGTNLNIPVNKQGQIDQSKINSMLTFDNNGEELYNSGNPATKATDYNLPPSKQTALGRAMSWWRGDNKVQSTNNDL